MLTVEQAIELIPISISKNLISITPLNSTNNRIYKIQTDKQSFILRLNNRYTDIFNIDRKKEIKVLRNASLARIAPEIIYEDYRKGILLTLFVEGRTWHLDDFEDQTKIRSLVKLLHSVHSLPLCGLKLNPVDLANNYILKLDTNTDSYEFSKICLSIIKNIDYSGNIRCCHNDIHPLNIIQGEHLMLIDWEYAYDNDPMFEIASISSFNNLRKGTELMLLDEYFGGSGNYSMRDYLLQKKLYEAIYWLWLACKQSNSGSNRDSELLLRLKSKLLDQ